MRQGCEAPSSSPVPSSLPPRVDLKTLEHLFPEDPVWGLLICCAAPISLGRGLRPPSYCGPGCNSTSAVGVLGGITPPGLGSDK